MVGARSKTRAGLPGHVLLQLDKLEHGPVQFFRTNQQMTAKTAVHLVQLPFQAPELLWAAGDTNSPWTRLIESYP